MIDWIVFLLLFGFYLACATRPFTIQLRKFADSKHHGFMLVLMLLVPFVLIRLPSAAASPTVFLRDVGVMLIFLTIPTLATLYRPANAKPLHWLDIVTIVAVWFAIEFGWLPEADAVLGGGIDIPVPLLIGIDMLLVLFLLIRPLPKIGYTFRINKSNLKHANSALMAYTLTGVPFGLLTGFLVFNMVPFNLNDWVLAWPLGYIFVALPEELLFRGIIQNQLHGRFKNEWAAILIASILFGLAHLNNGTTGFPEPNWMFAISATIAGLAYGWTWRKTGKITVSALVHATINFVWGIFLTA